MDAPPNPTDAPKRAARSRAGSGSAVSTLINVLLLVGVALIVGLVLWTLMTDAGRSAVSTARRPGGRGGSGGGSGGGGGGGGPSVVTVNSNTAAAVKSLAGRFRGGGQAAATRPA